MPPSHSHIDPELFTRLADGDKNAYRQLFDQLKLPFFAAAFKMTRSQSIAEEIVQEVFVTCWTQRQKLAEALQPQAYVFKILHHQIYNHLKQLARQRQLQEQYSQEQYEAEELSAEDILLAKENQALLNALVHQLPPQQQKIYLLSKREGMSREAIAAELGISANTVRNHLKAATDSLREAFKNNLSALIWIAIWQSL